MAIESIVNFYPCKDIEETTEFYAKFKELNIEGLIPPKKHDQFEVYSFFMRDPNGYQIEFQKIKK